jgi:probable lipoprotein NlpC
MGLGALIKKYPVIIALALLSLGSCRSMQNFHLRSSALVSPEEREQQQLAYEFKKQEKKAARQARKSTSHNKHLARKSTNKKVEKVIATARSYYGTPYKFGGTTRIGIDCSGLLCQSFSAIDVKLPRNSTDQSLIGPKVHEKDLQKGDLVFFTSSRGGNQITHVGLVTEVVRKQEEVRFIHSSTSLGVKEDNLYSDYWQKLFLKAVRPSF